MQKSLVSAILPFVPVRPPPPFVYAQLELASFEWHRLLTYRSFVKPLPLDMKRLSPSVNRRWRCKRELTSWVDVEASSFRHSLNLFFFLGPSAQRTRSPPCISLNYVTSAHLKQREGPNPGSASIFTRLSNQHARSSFNWVLLKLILDLSILQLAIFSSLNLFLLSLSLLSPSPSPSVSTQHRRSLVSVLQRAVFLEAGSGFSAT